MLIPLPVNTDILIQCCFDVGPTSKTAGQHQNSIGSACRVYWATTEQAPIQMQGKLGIFASRMSEFGLKFHCELELES